MSEHPIRTVTLGGLARLWLAGALGVGAALAAIRIPPATLERLHMTPAMALGVSAANNAVILLVAVAVGGFCAGRLGLVSLIAGNAPGDAACRGAALPAYALGGVVIGGAIAYADHAFIAAMPALHAYLAAHGQAIAAFEQQTPLLMRLLYGGLTEEILLRWCMMSLIAWLAFLLLRRRRVSTGVGVALAALLFGLGHLPATFQIFPDAPAALALRVVVLNAALGLVYGGAFARNSLEAGMAAHAATHIGFALAARLLPA